MAEDRSKQQLIRFLERRVWNPVLKASPDRYPERERSRVERVRRKTETQRQRYESYQGAGEVRQEFQDDLRSEAARKTNADLKKLNLPLQADVADEFFALADRLGVESKRGAARRRGAHSSSGKHTRAASTQSRGKRSRRASAKSHGARSSRASAKTRSASGARSRRR